MTWLLACIGADPVEDSPPPGASYTGETVFTSTHLVCYGTDQSWQVYTRGVAEVELSLQHAPTADTGDTAVPEPVSEEHVVPLVDQDPGGWWALHTLSLVHADNGFDGTSRIACADAEEGWTLRLLAGAELLDCAGDGC